ncbi:hypothetical protein VdG2_05882 [Verticillium dahliae VDG2]|nr:hypothetical protein VdG2_05882 [Verticillium dahliae VDG2]
MSSHATALSSTKPEGQVAVARAKYTRRRVRGWETTKLFLRSLSLTVFLGIFITNMTYLLPLGATNSALDDIWPWMTMAAAGPALLWDVADLLTLWVRRGRAIAPKAQIGIELTAASLTSVTARDTDSFAGTEAQTDVTSMTTLVPGPSQAASITARQRPLMRPPPEGYEPDEAEMERRRRGDAQPQFMVAEVVDMKFASNVVVNPQEGKFLVESSRSPGVAGESSRSQLRSAPMGETRADRPRSWG